MGEYSVYKHTCPNGKCYIGITRQDPTKRWNWGRGYDTQLFGRAIKKYGWKNITHEVLLSGLTQKEALEKEQYYITFYKSQDALYGYNCTSGGEGAPSHKVSETQRREMSLRTLAMWDNPQMREKLLAHLKELSKKNKGRHRPESATAKTIAHTSKPVWRLSLSGEKIKRYPSLSEAARDVGGTNSLIVRCCKKNKYSAYGFYWRYAD